MTLSLRHIHELALDPANAAYIEQMHERWEQNPTALDSSWQAFFSTLEETKQQERFPENASAALERLRKLKGAHRLIGAYRMLGHLMADTDPLGVKERKRPYGLKLEEHDLSSDDLDQPVLVTSIDPDEAMPLHEVIRVLNRVYCGSLGSESFHLTSTRQRRWITHRLEQSRGQWAFALDHATRRRVLKELTAAEGLEHFLHRRYVGQKRFSLEGCEVLIPLLNDIVQQGGRQGVEDIVIGMAHRGRLNVLVNTLGKPPRQLFREFDGELSDELSGSGDVKYHQGYYSEIDAGGRRVRVSLAFNPSHLEVISPVVLGGVRARQDSQPDGDQARNKVVPVILHGDAAFSGQGIVAETFNLSKTTGYGVGGAIHIVINNQIGFTTSSPLEARSTLYCTEAAKIIKAPIFHVNGDDPDAVIFVTRLALDYRNTFNNDVVIDVVCYRRHGHNEADEPMMTQPVMYSSIRKLKPVRERYAEMLVDQGLIADNEAKTLWQDCRSALEKGASVANGFLRGSHSNYAGNWLRYLSASREERVDTRVSLARLQGIGEKVTTVPEGFVVHRRVAALLEQRQKMMRGDILLDWGMAETLAYGSLLQQGYAVRLSGQDSGRGTFSHRHAEWHHQQARQRHVPLQHLFAAQPMFRVINSLLSEMAVLGFEYGYATSSPETLVIWEAQFGDFANMAQVMIDQFLVAGHQKWGRLCQLVLFLPHGYEGQGPEHSSARLERYLQLCAQRNMRVWMPTTPAQLFHLLRNQMMRSFRRPLIVMMPKSLLRHPLSKSPLEALTDGALERVLRDDSIAAPKAVRRVVLCSGKIWFELQAQREREKKADIALVRIEQLYPFPRDEAAAALADYSNAEEIVWCQEEPRNQGAWYQIRHHLQALTTAGQQLHYAGKAPSASTACGYHQLHQRLQQQVLDLALSEQMIEDGGDRLEDY